MSQINNDVINYLKKVKIEKQLSKNKRKLHSLKLKHFEFVSVLKV